MRRPPYRRCLECNFKTSRKLWEENNNSCPICEGAYGYVESMHGGLNPPQIKEIRRELRITSGKLGIER